MHTGRSISARFERQASCGAADSIFCNSFDAACSLQVDFQGAPPRAPRFPFLKQGPGHTRRREGSLIFPPTDVARGDASDELRLQEPSAQPQIRMKAISAFLSRGAE